MNADSYALDGLAIYVQQHYKSSMPPVPYDELAKLDAAAHKAVKKPASVSAKAKTFGDKLPPGWKAPATAVQGNAPWVQLNADSKKEDNPQPASSSKPRKPTPKPKPKPKLKADKNACHGISGDYWVMSRDVAVSNVKEFCAQTMSTQTFNSGTDNELELSVKAPGGIDKAPKDAPSCVARFQNAVIDGCDGGDAKKNPHNYKFGSTLTTMDEWQYTMKPLAKQVGETSCDVSFKAGAGDFFEIRGKNVPDDKGSFLEDKLAGCRGAGDFEKWKFELTPGDCCFAWYASGYVPGGQRSCIGKKLVEAGGSGVGHCHGLGKRDVNSIDSWPGYGDEDRHVFGENAIVMRDNIMEGSGFGNESRHDSLSD